MNKNRIKDIFWQIAGVEQDVLKLKARVPTQVSEEILLSIAKRHIPDEKQVRLLRRLNNAYYRILIIVGHINNQNNPIMTEKLIPDLRYIYEIWEELFRYIYDHFDELSERLDSNMCREDYQRAADEVSNKIKSYLANLKTGRPLGYPIDEPSIIRDHYEKALNLILGFDSFEKFRLESNIAIDEINILLQQLTLMCPDNGQIH